MNYLFLVAIGPVQGFIDTARRTRDLAFGSWLLSELAKAAAHAIVAHDGLTSLIFPAPENEALLMPDSDLSVANKIIALVQSPQMLGPLVRDAVKKRLGELMNIAYKRIPFDESKRAIAEAQVFDLVELTWVALPFDGQDYEGTRKQLEALLAARKNTRDFAQFPKGNNLPKSSLDGQLESVIPEHRYPSAKASENERRRKLRTLYDEYGAGPAEQLSGVDLLKRRGVAIYGDHFPSTSHIATQPFLQRLELLEGQHLLEAQTAWHHYIEEIRQHVFSSQLERIPDKYPVHPILDRYDGSMLLEDRLVDILYEPGAQISRDNRFQKVREALNNFYKVLNAQFAAMGYGKAQPGPYYALLQADGDGMGTVIDAQAALGSEQHRALSQQLATFAEQVKKIVPEHRGALVYAGGDDVVAFLPLNTALVCAQELAKTFQETMNDFKGKDGHSPTLSVGIAIVHHLDALRRVRDIAKTAEKNAKAIKGRKPETGEAVQNKNALAIIVSKRSGEDYSVAGQWGDLDVSLQKLVDFYQKGAIPVGTAYELRELALLLGLPVDKVYAGPREKPGEDENTDVIRLDALRIIQRKLGVPRSKFPEKQVEEVARFFKARLGDKQEDIVNIKPVPLSEVINELIVAQLLAEAQLLARPEQKGGRR